MSIRLLPLLLIPALVGSGMPFRAQAPAAAVAPAWTALADARLGKWFDAQHPGAAVLLMQDGNVLLRKGYGLANVDLGLAVDPDMAFGIGAVTQQFTAAAVMKLVEDGKVGLGVPVARYLDSLPAGWRAITVQQLLNHTSGLPSFTGTQAFLDHPEGDPTPAKLLERTVYGLPLEFLPGTRQRRSDTGYLLLGLLIEKVSGQSYPAFLQQRLLDPLGLKQTRFGSGPELGRMPVRGYEFRDGARPAAQPALSPYFAAGGLVASAGDLARWTLALHEGRVVESGSLAQMLAPTWLPEDKVLPCGFGLELRSSQGHRLVAQTGEAGGFSCRVEADPAARSVAVILTNSASPTLDCDFFCRYLLGLAAGTPIAEPRTIALEPAKLVGLAGWYQNGKELRVVTVQGGKLFIRLLGDPKLPLLPLSETKFAFEDSDATLQFTQVGGKVTGLRTFQDDKRVTGAAKRLGPIPDQDPEITARVRQGLLAAAAGTLGRELFTPALAEQIFPDRVKAIGAALKGLGPCTALETCGREAGADGVRYSYLAAFGAQSVLLRFRLAQDGRINWISTSPAEAR